MATFAHGCGEKPTAAKHSFATATNQKTVLTNEVTLPAAKQSAIIGKEDAVEIAMQEARKRGWTTITVGSISYEKGYWLIYLERDQTTYGAFS